MLAAFSAELARGESARKEVVATLQPPPELDGLLETADIRFSCSDISLIGDLTIAEIIELRKVGDEYLTFPGDIPSKPVTVSGQDSYRDEWLVLDKLRNKYIRVFERYLRHIAQAIEGEATKGMYRQNVISAFIEKNPRIKRFMDFNLLSNFVINQTIPSMAFAPIVGPMAALGGVPAVKHLAAFVLQTPSEARKNLDALLPQRSWRKNGIIKI